MKNTVKKSLLLSSAAVPFSQLAANIVVTSDVNLQIDTSESIYIDFEGSTTSGNSFPTGTDIVLGFSFNQEKPLMQSSGSYTFAISSSGYIAKYSLGNSLNFTNTVSGDSYFEFDGAGNWADDESGSSAYVALQNTTNSKEFWLEIDYDDPGNTLTLISFAVADASDNITAGQTQVPEPAETSALMALLAGSTLLFRNRRKHLTRN